MNNGSWIDFSKSGCYSMIYTLFLLIMTISLKILSDNLGQSSLPSMSQKSWGKSQVSPTFLYATADGSAPSGPICTIFLLVMVKAYVQKLSKFYQNRTKYVNMAVKKPIFWWRCGSCRIQFLNPLWPNSCNFFGDSWEGACLKTLQVLPESDLVCKHSSQKTGKALLLIVFTLQNINRL